MAGFLLDTNVISELVRKVPAPQVLQWVNAQKIDELYLSAVTLGELTRGIVRLPDSGKRDKLSHWIAVELPRQFENRILAFDQKTAVIWGTLMGEGDRTGHPYSATDAQIAATALRYSLVMVTRNTRDFEGTGVVLLDPWH